jgi:type II secretory pathway pseudopilin PulG
MASRTIAGNREQGFTLLAALITVAVLGAVLGAAATLYSQAAQRDKEAELLFIGDQYREAIRSYYERSPGGAKRYPQTLEELLEDRRFPTVTRHLRRLYADPLTGKPMVPVNAPMGGIMGVASAGEGEPIKTGNFRVRDAALDGGRRYSEWEFTYRPAANSPNGLGASQPGNNTAAAAK